VEELGIEQLAMQVLRAASGSAVQEQCGDATAPADLLDIDPVPVADLEHAGVERAQRVWG
jgi:hypothetical protein